MRRAMFVVRDCRSKESVFAVSRICAISVNYTPASHSYVCKEF
jgi:hypothetical protein